MANTHIDLVNSILAAGGSIADIDRILAQLTALSGNAPIAPIAETAVTPESAPHDNVGAMPIDPHDPTTWTIDRLSLKGNGALLKQALLWYDRTHTIADKTLRSALIFGKYPKDDRSYDGLVKADKRIDYLVKAAARIAQSKAGNATVIPTKPANDWDYALAHRNFAEHINSVLPIYHKYDRLLDKYPARASVKVTKEILQWFTAANVEGIEVPSIGENVRSGLVRRVLYALRLQEVKAFFKANNLISCGCKNGLLTQCSHVKENANANNPLVGIVRN
jgi:hypothetical protein